MLYRPITSGRSQAQRSDLPSARSSKRFEIRNGTRTKLSTAELSTREKREKVGHTFLIGFEFANSKFSQGALTSHFLRQSNKRYAMRGRSHRCIPIRRLLSMQLRKSAM